MKRNDVRYRGRRVAASLLSVVIVVSVIAGFVVVTSEPASAQIPIDGCTQIRSPGTYVLTQDIETTANTCIAILSHAVTFDGQGHTIARHGERDGFGIYGVNPIGARELDDVTIRDVTVRGFRNGVTLQGTNDAVVRESTIAGNIYGIFVDGDRMQILENTVTDSGDTGIVFRGDSSVIDNNTVTNSSIRGIYVRFPSASVDITFNTVTDHRGTYRGGPSPGILVTGSSNTIARNNLDRNEIGVLVHDARRNTVELYRNDPRNPGSNDVAVELGRFASLNTVRANQFRSHVQLTEATDNVVENNTLLGILVEGSSGNDIVDNELTTVGIRESIGTSVLGNRVTGQIEGETTFGMFVEESSDSLIRGNVISNKTEGVRISQSDRTTIQFNRIEANDVGVRMTRVSLNPMTTITSNSFLDNSEYGIQNERNDIVDARFNYWGGPSGPSSPEDPDAPFEDPVNGHLAEGDGDAISEMPSRPGVSNVRFSPWARTPNPVTTLPPYDPGPPVEPPAPPVGPGPLPGPDSTEEAESQTESPTETSTVTETVTETGTENETKTETPAETEIETEIPTANETAAETETETPTETQPGTGNQTESPAETPTATETTTETENETDTEVESEIVQPYG